MQRGVFEFKVGEPAKDRGFSFGTYALGIASKEYGSPLSELLKKIGIGVKPEEGKTVDIDVLALLSIFYGAAVQYAEENNLPVDFKTVHVSKWVDELGLDQTQKMLVEGLTQYEPKNSESLA